MAKSNKNPSQNPYNTDNPEVFLDDIDKTILNIAKTHPEWNNNQIANRLVKIGDITSPDTVYKRIRKKDYLSMEIKRLRDVIKEQHTREIFPLAQKQLKKSLKDNELDPKTKFNYVKLAYDKEMGDKSDDNAPQIQINIDKLQAVMGTDFG